MEDREVNPEELDQLLNAGPKPVQPEENKTKYDVSVTEEEIEKGEVDLEKESNFVSSRISEDPHKTPPHDTRFERSDKINEVNKLQKKLDSRYKELAKPTDVEKSNFVRCIVNLKEVFETPIEFKDIGLSILIKSRNKFEDEIITEALNLDYQMHKNHTDGLGAILQNIRYYSALVMVKEYNGQNIFFNHKDLKDNTIFDRTKTVSENAKWLQEKTKELLIGKLDSTVWFVVNAGCSIFENKLEQLRDGVLNDGFFSLAG